MSVGDRTEERINTLLATWNPLDVPTFIAEDEYKSYAKDIMLIGRSEDELTVFLHKLLVDILGIELDEDDDVQRKDIQRVVVDLLQILGDDQQEEEVLRGI